MKHAFFLLACCQALPEPVVLGPLGGAGTVKDATLNAYGQMMPHVSSDQRVAFASGNSFFRQAWVTAPASAEGTDGLGPVFNARSCSGCHFLDGRGRPPSDGESEFTSMLVRLSNAPAYGDQLQTHAIAGVPPEGNVRVRYEEVAGVYGDGERYTLLKPVYEFYDLNFGSLEGALFSPRVGNAVYGLGLLEAVDDADIDAWISAHPSVSGRRNIGRFGWKANVTDLTAQISGAFLGDIGITSLQRPAQNCTPEQAECLNARGGGEPELPEIALDRLLFYTRALAVPAQRDADERGNALFQAAGCADCHAHTLHTRADAALPELASQTIHPFTDLLVHDMGEGLADGRPDQLADGNEWRTPPLWGLGLLKVVNEHDRLLHDGRARGFAEAILWHGGEGDRAREYFRHLPRKDREALLRFLESL